MDKNEDYKFSIITGSINVVLVIIFTAFIILKFMSSSLIISSIAGGSFLLCIISSYVLMINSFSNLNKIKDDKGLANYKDHPNYRFYLGMSIYATCIFIVTMLFLLITYIKYEFKLNEYNLL
jgi:hypothetical protein